MTQALRRVRWGDNDRHFGPFTWSYSSSYKHWAVVLRSSGDGDGSDVRGYLRVTLRGATVILSLPDIVKPHRRKVYLGWDERTVKRLGRDWYWDVDPRQYGISLSDGLLSVYYGRTGGACMDSSVQQQWSCFLPWTQWRHVRFSIYGLAGEHVWSSYDWIDKLYRKRSDAWEVRRRLHDSWINLCPVVQFAFMDFDGEELVATTRIEEREWRFGTGWFKWLSWFRRAKVRRRLNIEFSGETGPEKGSWKGGTLGTGIAMLPGELHEAAFRRYCEEEHRAKYRKYRVTFIGAVS